MAGDILSIGKSGLMAAQAGLATTGHNITNANVAGYNRQVVVQSTATPVGGSWGFMGSGTQIAQIKRYSDDFLTTQVRSAQASKSALDAYYGQVSQIDNMMSDTTSGLSPALQDFFKGVQDVTGNQASVPSRQALLSAGGTLASRFHALDGRLQEIREGLNGQIASNVTVINSYAQQIAQLNDQIGKLSGNSQNLPNDLMDKRDQLVAELNKQVKATVVAGDNHSLTVSIGSGQPLVVGKQAYQLAVTTSPTDQSRVEVAFLTAGKLTVMSENALTGGELGGLLDFRANSLDPAQNALGRIAIGLASTFNAQHKLGVDMNGDQGADFFTQASAFIGRNVNNNATSTTEVAVTVSDPTKLTASDYKVEFDGSNYNVIRLSDNKKTPITPYPQLTAQTIDGLDFAISGSAAAGDNFLVRPTIKGAQDFKLALTDVSQVAAAAPIATSMPLTNRGSGAISEGKVDQSYFASPLAAPMTLTLDSATNLLSGFPAAQAVTVASGGATTTYPAGTPVSFTSGATYTVGGISFSIGGAPANGDSFTISASNAIGDTRNAGLLGDLQTTNIFDSGSTTYQSAYAQLVGTIGNKTREVQVNGQASDALLSQATSAAQDVSGVNLDEEATNLLKYQQAYQAAGKVMQIANTVFNTLLSIGGQ